MKKLVGILFILVVVQAFGQKDDSTLHYPIYDPYDYTNTKHSPIDLIPTNVDVKIVYNPETGMYEVFQTIGGIDYRFPTALTLDEYIAWQRKKALEETFREKVNEQNEQQHANLGFPI